MVTRSPTAWVILALLFAPILPAQAEEDETVVIRKVAAGLHEGHAFGPRLRSDGKWVAYGVREQVKGTFKTSYYTRDLDGGLFRSVWPNAHPSFTEGEGIASFTDLVGFEWARNGQHNAMVVRHKSLGEEVLLETISVRFTGPGAQSQPSMAPDGTRMVVVSEAADGSGADLWVADTVDGAVPLQLTFTRESEQAPSWHPKEPKIIHEVRNPLGSDIHVFDLDSFRQTPLVRLGTSDEVEPSYAPVGDRYAYLSNKDGPDGLRWDLFVGSLDGALPRTVIRNVRRSEKSRGYCWDPHGRYLIAVQDDPEAGYPLVISPADGSAEPRRLVETTDNMDPTVMEVGDQVRLAWVALDLRRPEANRYRIVFVADFTLHALDEIAGVGDAAGDSRAGG